MPQQKTILIIDDNQDNIDLLAAIFSLNHYQTIVSLGTKHAHSVLAAHDASSIDLILCDASMPQESGFDFLKWIKKQNDLISQIPFLLITSEMFADESRVEGLSLGALDYIARPIDSKELLLRVEHAIDQFDQFKALQSSLADANTIASAGQVCLASTHEMKNLANIIHVMSSKLTNSASVAEPIQREIEAICDASSLLRDLCISFGQLVGKNMPTKDPVCLDEQIEKVMTMSQSLNRYTVTKPQFSPCGEKTWAYGNQARIKQIILNLLFNALEATSSLPKGKDPQIIIKTRQEKNRAYILVIDNGVGLSEPKTINSFTAFHTTKTLKGGRGLGLWLCSHLAELMNGFLQLRSEGPHLGCQATLSLPLANEPCEKKLDLSDYLLD